MPDAPSNVVSEHAPPAWLIWAAMGVVYVIWSTTYLAIKVVNETLPTLLATSVRFLVAGAVLYGIAIRRGDRVGDRPTRRNWRAATIVAVLLFVCGNAGVAWGERTIPSGLAALVIATMPLWMAVIDRVAFHHRQPPLVVGGLVLGFVGAAILVQGSISGHVDLTRPARHDRGFDRLGERVALPTTGAAPPSHVRERRYADARRRRDPRRPQRRGG